MKNNMSILLLVAIVGMAMSMAFYGCAKDNNEPSYSTISGATS